MSLEVQALNYGWAALLSLGSLTNSTIYNFGATRQLIVPEDVIEIAVGIPERCVATQTGSNSYGLTPPTIIRTWYSNAYSSNSVVSNAYTVTNTIGWFTDREMLVSHDATLRAAVVLYYPTNAVETTNLNYLTITGVWAALPVGDTTSQFTQVPCWTNQTVTNYLICYTSYWPTDGATFPTTNCYTSTFDQVVNYGASWTATGGVVWATLSNCWASWATSMIQTQVFGEWPWLAYPQSFEERYKVAWYLQKTAHTLHKYDLDKYYGSGVSVMREVINRGDNTYYNTNYNITPAAANAAALADAQADYKYVGSGAYGDEVFRQEAYNHYYSNEASYVGEWQTNLVMTGGTNLIFTTNVIVDASESLPITNLYLGIRITGMGYDVSNIVVGSTGNYTLTDNTNALMMSGGDPDMSGGYAYDSFNNNYIYLTVGGVDNWDPGPALLVWLPDSERYSWTNSCVGCITGLYYPYDVPTNLSSGTVTGTWEVVSNSLSFDFSGTYITNGLLNGSNSWFCDDNDCYIYATNGQWVVATNDAVDLVNDLYLYANAPVGTYAASNFFTGSSTGGWDVTHYFYTNMDGDYYQTIPLESPAFGWTNQFTETNSGHVFFYTNYNGTNMMYMPGDDPADWWFNTDEWFPVPSSGGWFEPGGASLARHYYTVPPLYRTNLWFTNLPAWSGTYSNSVEVNGQPSWFCTNNGCYVYYSSDGLWQISTNVNIKNTSTSAPFLWNSMAFPTGTYNASNFYITYATATYDYVTLATTNSPSGVYTPIEDGVGGKSAWISTNGYQCDSTDAYYRVWRDDGGHTDTWVELDQEMPPTGFGQVYTAYPGDTVTGLVTIVSTQAVKSWIVGTNAYVEYSLTKLGGDFAAYLSTSIYHRIGGAFVYPTAPDYASHNYWNNQGLTLISNAWNYVGASGWSWDSNNAVSFGGDLSAPPSPVTWEATVPNESGAEGFRVIPNPKSVGDWDFLYCTNKYW
jgi:hypothetical protein